MILKCLILPSQLILPTFLLIDLQFIVNNHVHDPRSVPATAEPYVVVEEPFEKVVSNTCDVDAHTLDFISFKYAFYLKHLVVQIKPYPLTHQNWSLRYR
jgi:hypothetical protein